MEPSKNPCSCSSPLLHSEKIEWTWEENKLFENALAELNHDSPSLFEQIALKIPGKNVSQIKEHFDALIEDIKLIEQVSESDYIPSPKRYRTGDKGKEPDSGVKNKIIYQGRKRGVLWTPKEHELFLQGLEKYGKGDWKSISRNCVVTRTPTQVASHAQKYFIRLQKSRAKNIKSSSSLK